MILLIIACVILAVAIMMICKVVWENEKYAKMDEKWKSEDPCDRLAVCVHTLTQILSSVGATKDSDSVVRVKKTGHVIKVDSSRTPCRCTIYDKQNKKVYSGSMIMCAVIVQSLASKK